MWRGTAPKDQVTEDTRAYSTVNELTQRALDTNNAAGAELTYTLDYSETGNLIDDGKDYTYIYDAFNRLTAVKTRGGSPVLVADYTYNGLGHRSSEHYDITASGGTGSPDGTVDSSDPTFFFCYDERWRRVATFRGFDSDPKEAYHNHFAGLDGMGGSSYIDLVAWRDRDSTALHLASDGVLDKRDYYCQNWRADVSALITDTGKMLERVKYSAYGVPFGLAAGDTEGEGNYDKDDETEITNDAAADKNDPDYTIRKDVDMDGDVDPDDILAAEAVSGGYNTLGRGVLSASTLKSRKGYAGYEKDTVHVATYSTRIRVWIGDLGVWSRRDPLGYVTGPNLYEYCATRPVLWSDAFGLDPNWPSQRFPCAGNACIPTAPGFIQPTGAEPIPDLIPFIVPAPTHTTPLVTPEPPVRLDPTGVTGSFGLGGNASCCLSFGFVHICVGFTASMNIGTCMCQGLNGIVSCPFVSTSTCIDVTIKFALSSPGCRTRFTAPTNLGIVEKCPPPNMGAWSGGSVCAQVEATPCRASVCTNGSWNASCTFDILNPPTQFTLGFSIGTRLCYNQTVYADDNCSCLQLQY